MDDCIRKSFCNINTTQPLAFQLHLRCPDVTSKSKATAAASRSLEYRASAVIAESGNLVDKSWLMNEYQGDEEVVVDQQQQRHSDTSIDSSSGGRRSSYQEKDYSLKRVSSQFTTTAKQRLQKFPAMMEWKTASHAHALMLSV